MSSKGQGQALCSNHQTPQSSTTGTESASRIELNNGAGQDNNGPSVNVQPDICFADEMLDIQASGLRPGQLVTLRAQVFTEDGKYRFLSTAQYKAREDGTVKAQRDPSLGGSYTGIEPMGLFWGAKPAPEAVNKYPRLVKWDVTRPFRYTIDLVEGLRGGHNGSSGGQFVLAEEEGEGDILASKVIERRYLADYVEQVPLNTGLAEGMLFLPKKRGSSDPLPLIIEMRGLSTRLVVDRAVTLASHGFAVFAFDYYIPRRMGSTDRNVYVDGRAFFDIINFAKEHPRLDETRIGIVSACSGSTVMLHAATRLNLPVKCLVAAGFMDVLCACVGLSLLDGTKLEPDGLIEDVLYRYEDEHGCRWAQLSNERMRERFLLTDVQKFHTPVKNLNCPLLMFVHGDDQHIISEFSTMFLKERLEKARKSHLVECVRLPGTGHFLEFPYQPITTVSSLLDPTVIGDGPKLFYTPLGGENTIQAARDQKFAWMKMINFFRKHLEVKEIYRKDWLADEEKGNDSPNGNVS